MNVHDWQILMKSKASESFLFLKPDDSKEQACCGDDAETQVVTVKR